MDDMTMTVSVDDVTPEVGQAITLRVRSSQRETLTDLFGISWDTDGSGTATIPEHKGNCAATARRVRHIDRVYKVIYRPKHAGTTQPIRVRLSGHICLTGAERSVDVEGFVQVQRDRTRKP